MNSPKLQPEWIAPGRTALLLIDFQVDFALPEGGMAREGADVGPALRAVAQAALLAEAARGAGVMLVFTRSIAKPQADGPVLAEARARRGEQGKPRLCVEGTPGAAFVGPQPQDGDLVVSKHRYSIFHDTELEAVLKAKGIDTLVVTGLTTECCVQSSVWAAFERQFHVFVAADACAAYENDLHQVALKAMELSGANLALAADFAAAWKTK
jgi:ureidoacrylate peracid hydrolase